MSGSLALVETGTESLIYYEQARHALEQARTADEVNHIMGVAEGFRAAARMAQDREMETTAAEIRIRAVRRLGEMLREHKETVGFNKGGGVAGHSTNSDSESVVPTLEEIGVAPKLSMEAQSLAGIASDEFEDKILYWRKKNGRVTVSLYTNGDAPGIPHRPDSRCPTPSPPRVASDPDYHEEVWLYIQRRKALGLSQAALDQIIGWGEGQASKLELPHDNFTGRIASGLMMSQWRRGLGLGIQLVPVG